ncbi:unnamed protein product [Rhizoctonia solani]|uniref:Uncharacterized protein n=1 Tax=Rhizoctonia solani TaxID=456999 RepID=A0A8H3D322_9AGAM|nr:unnamed protein product [Rhizoctonia solani]
MLPKDCHENQTLLLCHAAECLAKAAITLSEAAEAIAAAGKAFVSDNTSAVSVPPTHEDTQTNTGINTIVDYESDSDSSPISENLDTPRHTNNARRGPDESEEFKSGSTEEDPITRTGNLDDEEYRSTQSALQGIQGGDILAATHKSPAEVTQESVATTQSTPNYRILLDDEADVLLAVCCLIRRGRRAICYVRSQIKSLSLYEAVLSVVGVPVHTIHSSSSQELEQAVKMFQEDQSSVLLLPATFPPSLAFRTDEADSLVIHVGWPTDEGLYKQQITVHQAKRNVFVAYSEDKDIYPSSSSILMHTQPWPQNAQITEACTALRPLFNKRLDEIPAKSKAHIYTGWIYQHGRRGPHNPPSWTASMLVYRANLYLLDVLKYNTGNSTVDSGMQIALPEVPAGFVASQNLESAVEEGILRVKSTSESGVNHITSLTHADGVPAGAIFLNEGPSKPVDRPSSTPAPSPAARPEGSNITTLGTEPQRNKASSSTNAPNMTPTPSRSASRISSNIDTDGGRAFARQGDPLVSPRVTEYLIIESEPDVIPLICHLSTQPNSKNVICFVKVLSVFIPLTTMLEQMIAKPVFYVNATGWLFEGARRALQSSTGCLILCNIYDGLPMGLENIPFTIHFGWIYNPPTYRVQIQQSSNVVILLRRETQAPDGQELVSSLAQAGVSPASATTKRLYNRQAKTSILEPERDLLKMVLNASASIPDIRSSYMGFITHHYQGRYSEPGWTVIDVVTHANRYFKGLFRCGFGGDCIQGQPWVPRRFVEHLGLEAAVAAGLLIVMG